MRTVHAPYRYLGYMQYVDTYGMSRYLHSRLIDWRE